MTEATAPIQGDNDIAVLQARVRDLETALNQNNLDIAVAFQLTPALANLLGILLALPLATTEIIQKRLEISTDPKVAIHRLRRMMSRWHERLALTETPIKGRRCVGYWIEPDVKEKLRAMVTQPVTS